MGRVVPTKAEIEEQAAAYVAKVLGMSPNKVDRGVEFNRLGLDSTGAVALLMKLEEWLGIELAPEILFEYTNISKLASYLRSRAASESEAVS